MDGKDNSEMNHEEVSPKRNAKRTAKGKVVKYGSDEETDEQENLDPDESDYLGSDSETEKKVKKTKSKAKAPVNEIFFHSKIDRCFSLDIT